MQGNVFADDASQRSQREDGRPPPNEQHQEATTTPGWKDEEGTWSYQSPGTGVSLGMLSPAGPRRYSQGRHTVWGQEEEGGVEISWLLPSCPPSSCQCLSSTQPRLSLEV